jgi:hypothetical protein
MTKFVYHILNYVHSPLLDERINIGILYYFEKTDLFVFRYPEKYTRIKDIYSDFHEWQLKSSLRAIEENVWRLNNEGAILSSLRDNGKKVEDVLRTDSTTLQFSSEKSAISEHENIDFICESYFKLYFTEYKAPAKKARHDEEYLLRSFKQRLQIKNADAQNLLKKDVFIRSQKTSVKFEYEWHNGRANLVKPISFDLEEETSINQKAILIHGLLNFISAELTQNKFHIDLLLSPPSSNDGGLIKSYRNAVSILKEANADKDIIEENRLDQYVDHVAEAIHAPVNFPAIKSRGNKE